VRALVVAAPGSVGLAELDAPTPGIGDVLVRPVANGMCGTDLELIDGSIDVAYVRYPLTLGHEWVGRLVDDDDTRAPGGDQVVVEGVIPDGTCAACRRGATNLCETYDEIGFTRPGAAADLVVVPAHLVHRLEPEVAALDAALVEPMAVVWRALGRAGRVAGARCLVVGDGTIGLLCAYLLRRLAPAGVDMVGARAAQQQLARRAGVDRFGVMPSGERYDVVIEAAGQKSSTTLALASAARGGRVVLLGLATHGTLVEVAPDQLVNDDLTVQGSFSYTRDAFGEVVQMLNDGEVHPSFLVTHRFTLDEWALAVETLRSAPPDQPRGKVMLTMDGPAS
jgi:2-desacetyl-2-hydroxyethyl bacteriochlorophyllide A dehydrogenase